VRYRATGALLGWLIGLIVSNIAYAPTPVTVIFTPALVGILMIVGVAIGHKHASKKSL
jgi:uncharacterized membrane protein